MTMKRTGLIAGSFDVIHPGYIELFRSAKEKCEFLIVALHSDPTIERKDKIKPILTVKEREFMLRSIRYIDSIEVYDTEKDLEILLDSLKPDIRFLGDDYKDKDYTGKGMAKDVIFLDRSHGWSTTKFKKLVHDNYKEWSNTNE